MIIYPLFFFSLQILLHVRSKILLQGQIRERQKRSLGVFPLGLLFFLFYISLPYIATVKAKKKRILEHFYFIWNWDVNSMNMMDPRGALEVSGKRSLWGWVIEPVLSLSLSFFSFFFLERAYEENKSDFAAPFLSS